MAHSDPPSRRPWLVPTVLTLWFLLLHGRAADLGILSDSASMLLAASRPLGEALAHGYRYHTIPVTNLFTMVQWRLFGFVEWPYQALNLAGVLAVALLFRRLAERLTGDGRVAFLAAVVFLANASYFQIVDWSVVGTFQSLGVVFSLLALGAVLAGGPVRFALFSILAFFTYEPMVSVVPVGLLLHTLTPGPSPAGGRGENGGRVSAHVGTGFRAARIRDLRPWLLAAAAVGLVIALVKVPAVAGEGHLVNPPRGMADVTARLGLAARGTFATLALRASTPSLGLGFDQTPAVLAWLAGFALLAAWLVRRGTRATRFALGWFALHLALLTVSTRIASRHLYLLALPAALLLATALLRLHQRLPRRFATPVVALGLAFLAFCSGRDLARADRAHETATAGARDLEARVVDALRRGRQVHLVDLPAIVGREGLPAFAFLNGTHARIELAMGAPLDRQRVRLWTSAPPPPGPKIYANGSRPLAPGALEAWRAEPETTVLVWDPALARVTPRL